jgi:hypothetical protein
MIGSNKNKTTRQALEALTEYERGKETFKGVKSLHSSRKLHSLVG